MRLVDVVDGGERVPLDTVALEHPEALQDSVERRPAALVDPVGVVELRRAVDRHTDQEPVLLEEGGEGVVDQRAIGLDGVHDPLPGPRVLLLQLD